MTLGCNLTKVHVALWALAHNSKLLSCKFSGHRHSGSEDIMILVCHVILQDHLIKSSCDFMDRSPSR